MNLKKYYDNGITGMENLGNTCFLNACIQALNHTYELHELLDSGNYHKYLKTNTDDSTILVEWNDLRKVMWSGNGVVSPKKFVYNIHRVAKNKNKEIFTGYAQNDMPEFLLFLMDCIHNSISRSVKMCINGNTSNDVDVLAVKCYTMLQGVYEKEYSEIMDIFYGIYVSIITSKDGQTRHLIKAENYFVLDLPMLDGNYLADNIYDCFNIFCKLETLEGENAWFNEKTGKKEDITKRMSFWNFPKILIISLKRFTPDGQYKINKQIDFPLENLDLSNFVEGYNPKSYVYDLYGVCNHFGGVLGGHYTAFVKNAQNKWLHFNDTSVEHIDNLNNIVTPSAYCLFYRKKNSGL
jgi:ubiquitin carboxyl-terminal hydrolase 8